MARANKIKINLFKRKIKPKYIGLFLLILVLTLGLILPSSPVQAITLSGVISSMLGVVGGFILTLLGKLLLVLVSFLVSIGNYNDFGTTQAVQIGWFLVRDVCNMFFIIFLLVVAIGTILGIEQYKYNKHLGKILIMAILINFSKTITLIFIDVSQVAMLTFVHAYQDAAAGNLTVALGIDEIVVAADEGNMEIYEVIPALFLAIMMLIISIMIVGIMVVILSFRIVMLWILVVLSPVAYVASAFEPARKYASQWWQMFGKYLIIGPIMAFFLWLSFSVLGQKEFKEEFQDYVADTAPTVGSTEAGKPQNLLNFAVACALLVGSMIIGQQIGVAGGGLLGKAVQALQTYTPKAIIGFGSYLNRFQAAHITKGFSFSPTMIYTGIKEFMASKKAEDISRIKQNASARLNAGGLVGLTSIFGASRDFGNSYMRGMLYNKGVARVLFGKPYWSKKEEEKAKELEGQLSDEGVLIDEGKRLKIGEESKKIEALTQVSDKDYFKHLKEIGLVPKGVSLDQNGEAVFSEDKKNDLTAAEIGEQFNKDKESFERGKREKKAQDIVTKKYTNTELAQAGKQSFIDRSGLDKKTITALEDSLAGKASIEAELVIKARLVDNDDRKKKLMKEYADGKIGQPEFSSKARELNGEENILLQAQGNIHAGRDLTSGRKGLEEDREGRINLVKSRIKELDDIGNANWDSKDQSEYTNLKDELLQLNDRSKLTDKEKKRAEDIIKDTQTTVDDEARYRDAKVFQDDKERDKTQAQANKHIENADWYASFVPQDYEGRLDYMAQISEEMRKITTTNEDELIALQSSAIREGNMFKAAAVAMHAAKVGHGNEVVHAVKDKNGNHYSSGMMGLHGYINDLFIKKLGMSKQMALNVENQMSNTMEGINHWNMGQAVGYRHGQFYQRGLPEQQLRVSIERGKRDFEGMLRQGNRLAWMSEELNDPKDPSKGRYAVLTESALLTFVEKIDAIINNIGRGRVNPSTAANLLQPQNVAMFQATADNFERRGNHQKALDIRRLIETIKSYTGKEPGAAGVGAAMRQDINNTYEFMKRAAQQSGAGFRRYQEEADVNRSR